jgi:hypothetical protein
MAAAAELKRGRAALDAVPDYVKELSITRIN